MKPPKPRWLTRSGQARLIQEFSEGDIVRCRKTKEVALVFGVRGHNVWCYFQGRRPVNRYGYNLSKAPPGTTFEFLVVGEDGKPRFNDPLATTTKPEA